VKSRKVRILLAIWLKSTNFTRKNEQIDVTMEETKGKYLNPKADLTFKKIFGEHEGQRHDARAYCQIYWPLHGRDHQSLEKIMFATNEVATC
jgi:hypothetical protein